MDWGNLWRLLAQTALHYVALGVATIGLIPSFPFTVVVVISGFGAVVLLVANIVLVYRPTAAILGGERDTASRLLSYIAENYALRFAETDAPIRANLMQPDTRRAVDLDEGYVKKTGVTPEFHSGDYDSEELNLLWEEGQGCVGLAYEQDQIEWATREPQDSEWEGYKRMTRKQLGIVEDTNSVLCLPVYGPDHEDSDPYPTSILCLDSPAPASVTNFDDEEVRQTAFEEYVDDVAVL
jgi:hypothetical protein